MTYRECDLSSIKSDYVRNREAAEWRMLKRNAWLLFWFVVIAYAGTL